MEVIHKAKSNCIFYKILCTFSVQFILRGLKEMFLLLDLFPKILMMLEENDSFIVNGDISLLLLSLLLPLLSCGSSFFDISLVELELELELELVRSISIDLLL
jgi:hypothetical protein